VELESEPSDNSSEAAHQSPGSFDGGVLDPENVPSPPNDPLLDVSFLSEDLYSGTSNSSVDTIGGRFE